ncbi:MAG TPA: cupin domain-containing protein [Gemmatimonadaceae bacterium]|nr:cupin domain-containing protein [Gemmatimonadaceae bacterium]
MSIIERPEFVPMVGDPDDHRPNTSWAMVVDPVSADAPYVTDLLVVLEQIASGDRIPLHTHPHDEAIVIARGTAEVRLADHLRIVGENAVAMVPKGVAHSIRAVDGAVRINAFFPTTRIGIAYLERNPAPGTEGQAPAPPYEIDVRSAS